MLIAPRPTPSRAGKSIPMALAISLLVLIAFGGCGVTTYNHIVASEVKVDAAWSEIQSQYKRRFDLIPQLVETVKGAANFEQETLKQVVEARASVGQINITPQDLSDPAKVQQWTEAQNQLGTALSRLLVVAEKYPDLKASQAFLSLQDQIEGTENRIGTARRDYIDTVNAYNTSRRKFPGSLLAGMFGFEAKPQLTFPEANLDQAPKIDFGK
jgi:LemA protein